MSAEGLSLAKAWEGLQKAKPGIRIRDAAKILGCSEAELLATRIGEHCIRLEGNWPDFLRRLPELGYVMSLTRNESCVLEHKGAFQKVNILSNENQTMGTVIGKIETRVFFDAWHVAFAVEDNKEDHRLKSLQVFDHAGDSITKIFIQATSNEEAYSQLINDFRAADQSADLRLYPLKSKSFTDEIDKHSFLKDWENLQDTHDFFPMLNKYNLHRHHALEIALGRFCNRVDPKGSLKKIIDDAASAKLPIMIFAGNRGNLQIHQGKVRTIRVLDNRDSGSASWLNVLDPEFNMHLRQDHVHTVWVVKKPTRDGVVTSVEAFDKNLNLIVQFFGLRKPGVAENNDWTSLTEGLDRI